MKDIVIIGGGASGLLASIVLKSELKDNARITIVERLERVGKKILATGSGKANFTNEHVKGNRYNHPSFVTKLLKKFGYKEVKEFFSKLGLMTTVLTEGRVYPKSENANSLLDVLRNKIRELGIEEKCNFDVKKIINNTDKYIIESTRGLKLAADYVILATGGKATPILGSNGTGYQLAKMLKMKVTNVLPGLVGVKVDDSSIKGLEGLRVKAHVSLYCKKKKDPVWENKGEVQFKSEAVSGIVIMDMATQIARADNEKLFNASHFVLDLCPDMSLEDLTNYLINRQHDLVKYTNANFLIGIFHKMLGTNILKRAKVDVSGYVENLNKKDLERIAKAIKGFMIPIKGLDSFDHAQVTVGGISLDEVVPETLESRKNAGLYVCGELLDIDGDCGGYNLTFAFVSAICSAKAIKQNLSK